MADEEVVGAIAKTVVFLMPYPFKTSGSPKISANFAVAMSASERICLNILLVSCFASKP